MANSITGYFKLLEGHHPQKKLLSHTLKEALHAAATEKTYQKKQILLNENQIQRHLWFIADGSARLYHYPGDTGKTVTSWFWQESNLLFSFKNFFRRTETGEYIEMLEKSRVLSIPLKDLDQIYLNFPDYRLFERALFDWYHQQFFDHTYHILSQPSHERYLTFIKNYPGIIKIAAKQDIASFLKMHPSDFSRIHSLHQQFQK